MCVCVRTVGKCGCGRFSFVFSPSPWHGGVCTPIPPSVSGVYLRAQAVTPSVAAGLKRPSVGSKETPPKRAKKDGAQPPGAAADAEHISSKRKKKDGAQPPGAAADAEQISPISPDAFLDAQVALD
jgi:hypothetical protein